MRLFEIREIKKEFKIFRIFKEVSRSKKEENRSQDGNVNFKRLAELVPDESFVFGSVSVRSSGKTIFVEHL